MVKQHPLTCRASLSLPKQTASAAVQTACHLHTRSDSTRKQRNPFASLALGLMKKIRYLFLAVPTGHPLPSHTSDAADFAESKPVTALIVIRGNEAYAFMGAG